MVRRIVSALIGVLVAFAAGPAAAETRRALVIGIDDYRNVSKLQKAVGDARAMKAALERLGFEVDLLANPDRRGFNVGISAFTQKLKSGDTALVHFSGHGLALDGENYLLPSDVPQPGASDKELLKSESIALSVLVERVRASGARAQILIIDACRDNPYANAGTRSVGARGGLVNIQPPRGPGGIFIMYSAGYGQTAADRLSDNDAEPTSVYTRTLLRKITVEGKPITDLAREVREDVEALAATVKHDQRPAYYDELSGPPFFFRQPSGAVQQGSSRDVELAFWNSIKDSITAALYRDYLEKFGERAVFASIAREKIRELEGRRDVVPGPPPPIAPVATTFQPSFDCSVEGGRSERAICANAGLASRDRIMAGLFYRLIDALPQDARPALRSEQRDWLTRRRSCERGSGDFASCLAQAYDQRIAELQGRLPGTPVASLQRSTAPVSPSFECKAGIGVIEQAICADPALAAKDRAMADLYGRVTRDLAAEARAAVVQAQRNWLRVRGQCRDPGMVACVARAYDARIRELDGALTGR